MDDHNGNSRGGLLLVPASMAHCDPVSVDLYFSAAHAVARSADMYPPSIVNAAVSMFFFRMGEHLEQRSAEFRMVPYRSMVC